MSKASETIRSHISGSVQDHFKDVKWDGKGRAPRVRIMTRHDNKAHKPGFKATKNPSCSSGGGSMMVKTAVETKPKVVAVIPEPVRSVKRKEEVSSRDPDVSESSESSESSSSSDSSNSSCSKKDLGSQTLHSAIQVQDFPFVTAHSRALPSDDSDSFDSCKSSESEASSILPKPPLFIEVEKSKVHDSPKFPVREVLTPPPPPPPPPAQEDPQEELAPMSIKDRMKAFGSAVKTPVSSFRRKVSLSNINAPATPLEPAHPPPNRKWCKPAQRSDQTAAPPEEPKEMEDTEVEESKVEESMIEEPPIPPPPDTLAPPKTPLKRIAQAIFSPLTPSRKKQPTSLPLMDDPSEKSQKDESLQPPTDVPPSPKPTSMATPKTPKSPFKRILKSATPRSSRWTGDEILHVRHSSPQKPSRKVPMKNADETTDGAQPPLEKKALARFRSVSKRVVRQSAAFRPGQVPDAEVTRKKISRTKSFENERTMTIHNTRINED